MIIQTTVLKDDNNYNSEHGLQGNMYPSQSGTLVQVNLAMILVGNVVRYVLSL